MERKINFEEVKTLLSAIDDLIEIKLLIRKVAPNYDLNESLNNEFISLLKSLQKKLIPIFSKYIKQDISTMRIRKEIVDIMSSGNIALISSNSSKKKLKNIGIDPRVLIVSSGSLFFDDYKFINPPLPDNALQGIKKKCEGLIKRIKSEDWSEKDLIFFYERENPTDELILKRIDEISSIIGKKVKTFEITSWKDLDL
ncbi:MAG: DUF2100 domain-containing protein [Promethearchaeota archaeon]